MDEMYRRGYGRGPMYYPPQQVDPSIVSFGQLQMYDPEHYDRVAASIADSQQRYDATQAAIAKHMDGVGAADIDPRYRDEFLAVMSAGLDKLYGSIADDYDGDIGKASSRIIQNISQDRGLMNQLVIDTAQERQAKAEFQQLAVSGNQPHLIDKDGTRRAMTFDEYHQLGRFDSRGNFIRGEFNPLRGAADVSGYLERRISKALNDMQTYGDLKHYKDNGVDGMLKYMSFKGMGASDVEKYIKANGDVIAQQLLNEVPNLSEELQGLDKKEAIDAVKSYMTPIIKGQISSQEQPYYLQDPGFKGTVQTETPPPTFSPTIDKNAEVDDRLRKTLKQTDSALQAIDQARKEETINDALKHVIPQEQLEKEKSQWVNAGTEYRDKMMQLYQEGEISVGQRVGLFFSSLYRAGAWIADIPKHSGDIVKEWVGRGKNHEDLTNRVATVLGGKHNVTGEHGRTVTKIFEVDESKLTPEERKERQDYLKIAWTNESKRGFWGLSQAEDGTLSVDLKKSAFGPGVKTKQQSNLNSLNTQISNYVIETIKKSADNYAKAKEDELEKVSKLAEDNPIIPVIASMLVEDGTDLQNAVRQAISIFENTKINESIRFNRSKPIVYSDDKGGPTKEIRAYNHIKENLGENSVSEVTVLTKNDKGVDESTKKSFNVTIGALQKDDISRSFFNLNDFSVTVTGETTSGSKSSPFKYQINLEDAMPAQTKSTFVAMKEFIDAGKNLKYIKGTIDRKTGNYDIEYEEPMFISPDKKNIYKYSLSIDNGKYESVLLRYSHDEQQFVRDNGSFEEFVYGLILGSFDY